MMNPKLLQRSGSSSLGGNASTAATAVNTTSSQLNTTTINSSRVITSPPNSNASTSSSASSSSSSQQQSANQTSNWYSSLRQHLPQSVQSRLPVDHPPPPLQLPHGILRPITTTTSSLAQRIQHIHIPSILRHPPSCDLQQWNQYYTNSTQTASEWVQYQRELWNHYYHAHYHPQPYLKGKKKNPFLPPNSASQLYYYQQHKLPMLYMVIGVLLAWYILSHSIAVMFTTPPGLAMERYERYWEFVNNHNLYTPVQSFNPNYNKDDITSNDDDTVTPLTSSSTAQTEAATAYAELFTNLEEHFEIVKNEALHLLQHLGKTSSELNTNNYGSNSKKNNSNNQSSSLQQQKRRGRAQRYFLPLGSRKESISSSSKHRRQQLQRRRQHGSAIWPNNWNPRMTTELVQSINNEYGSDTVLSAYFVVVDPLTYLEAADWNYYYPGCIQYQLGVVVPTKVSNEGEEKKNDEEQQEEDHGEEDGDTVTTSSTSSKDPITTAAWIQPAIKNKKLSSFSTTNNKAVDDGWLIDMTMMNGENNINYYWKSGESILVDDDATLHTARNDHPTDALVLLYINIPRQFTSATLQTLQSWLIHGALHDQMEQPFLKYIH